MAPLNNIFKRTSDPSSSSIQIGTLSVPVYAVIGIAVIVAILLGLAIWLIVKTVRNRARRRREDDRGAAFLTVKGVVKDSPSGMKQTGFSRANLTASIVMPDKQIIRPNASRDEIISFYSEKGNLPRPFAPFSFALNTGHSPSPSSSTTDIQDKRVSTLSFSASAARLPPSSHSHSRAASALSNMRDSITESFFGGSDRNIRSGSALSNGTRLSVLSTGSSFPSSPVSGTGTQQRPVRQLFTPILPDEPVLTLGERVSVLRSFDDGWCIIARQKPYAGDASDEAELGAVPAWCFVKPMKGLRSERPVRSSSLGVTVQVDDSDRPRNDIISWSNF